MAGGAFGTTGNGEVPASLCNIDTVLVGVSSTGATGSVPAINTSLCVEAGSASATRLVRLSISAVSMPAG
jgi:hypothetical protein